MVSKTYQKVEKEEISSKLFPEVRNLSKELEELEKDEIVRLLEKLEKDFREISSSFYYSSPIVEYTIKEKEKEYYISFDLKDLLLIAGISGLSILLEGGTGIGKTTIAEMLMKAFFGKNYAFLQIDPSLSLEKFIDINFGAIKDGKKLSDAIEKNKIIDSPGVILDEINRAPPTIVNLLQNYITNGRLVFEGGKEFYPGIYVDKNLVYQLKIATMNEGEKYSGTYELDKALRDRFAVQINLDAFSPSREDIRCIIRYGNAKIESEGKDNLQIVLTLFKKIREIPLDPWAEEFVIYCSRIDQCIRSPQGKKSTILSFTPRFCDGCSAAALDKGICGNISAPSPRAIVDWIMLARGFALYRAYKFGGKARVEIEDLIAAAPFTLYSKMDINPSWIGKYCNGSKFEAYKEALVTAFKRWKRGLEENEEIIDKLDKGLQLTDEDYDKIKDYTLRDPWFFDVSCAIHAYRKLSETKERNKKEDRI
ncbi:MAG: MoxR family ATPase [Candidatus Aenigmatarchaeota archaeon]